MSRRFTLTLVPALCAVAALGLTACGDQVPGGMAEDAQNSDQVATAEAPADTGDGDDPTDDGGDTMTDDAGDSGGGLDSAAPEDPIVVQIGEDEFETNMAIYRRYDDAKGGPLALLAPESPAEDLAGGKAQEYRDGMIFWLPETGAHIVRGQILDTYLDNDGPTGRLGWPVGDETDEDGAIFSDFQNGQIRFEDESIHIFDHEE